MLGFAHMSDSKPKMQALLVVTRMDPDGNFYNKYKNVMQQKKILCYKNLGGGVGGSTLLKSHFLS